MQLEQSPHPNLQCVVVDLKKTNGTPWPVEFLTIQPRLQLLNNSDLMTGILDPLLQLSHKVPDLSIMRCSFLRVYLSRRPLKCSRLQFTFQRPDSVPQFLDGRGGQSVADNVCCTIGGGVGVGGKSVMGQRVSGRSVIKST